MGCLFFTSSIGIAMEISPNIIKDYLFGRTMGIVENENEEPLWII